MQKIVTETGLESEVKYPSIFFYFRKKKAMILAKNNDVWWIDLVIIIYNLKNLNYKFDFPKNRPDYILFI